MPTYITLVDYTAQGVEHIEDSPDRLDDAKALAESMGGSFEWYLTLGEHDAVTVGEFPDDQAMAQFLLAINRQGNVSTTTMKAFDEAEYRDVIAGIPG